MKRNKYITPTAEGYLLKHESALLVGTENNTTPDQSDAKKFDIDPVGDDYFNANWDYEEEKEEE